MRASGKAGTGAAHVRGRNRALGKDKDRDMRVLPRTVCFAVVAALLGSALAACSSGKAAQGTAGACLIICVSGGR